MNEEALREAVKHVRYSDGSPAIDEIDAALLITAYLTRATTGPGEFAGEGEYDNQFEAFDDGYAQGCQKHAPALTRASDGSHLHPWYGPCDELALGRQCAECLKVRASEGDELVERLRQRAIETPDEFAHHASLDQHAADALTAHRAEIAPLKEELRHRRDIEANYQDSVELLDAQKNTALARVEELEGALETAESAIKSLPSDALGIGGVDVSDPGATRWFIRDEVLAAIKRALSKNTSPETT